MDEGDASLVSEPARSKMAADEFDGKKTREHDPSFKGPIQDRSCTDIICCLIFVAYIVGMVVVGVVAFLEGNPDRLLLPTDSQGKICGKDYVDKKYLVFFDITTCVTKGFDFKKFVSAPSCPTPQVCVSKCPSTTASPLSVDTKDWVCKPGINASVAKIEEKKRLVRDGKCAPYYLKSSSVLYRCIPSLIEFKQVQNLDFGNNITKAAVQKGIEGLALIMDAQNVGMKIFEDVRMVWHWILAGFVISMLLALIYIVLTRWIAGPLVWLTILAVLALNIFGVYYMFNRYYILDKSGKSLAFEFTTSLDRYAQSKDTWLALGIILAVVFLILLLIILVLRKRIQIAVAMIKEASKAVMSMLSTLFFPLIPWLMQFALFAWFLAVMLYLATNGVPDYRVIGVNSGNKYNLTNGSSCDPKTFDSQYVNLTASCIMSGYKENVHLFRMQIFHLFGWLWVMNFIIALGQCVLAGAFASWYFAFHKPEDLATFPILSSFWRTLRYHTGSLAFGAAIIAIVQMIRITLEYIEKKLKAAGQDSKVASFILKCLKCCFWCLEKCLRFLNKNAYVLIAIYGKNFCTSAKDAFFLLLRNVLRVAAVNSVTGFLLFMGKLLIVGIVGVASFFWFRKVSEDDPAALNYDVVPMIITVVFAYVVAMLFFDVYDMAIDTIFLCFLEDLERNDGSAEKPYYMSSSLKKLLHVKNKTDNTDGEDTELPTKWFDQTTRTTPGSAPATRSKSTATGQETTTT